MTTLFCLHGFSQNGEALRSHMQPLSSRLPARLDLAFPDAPHECTEANLERLRRFLAGPTWPGPYRCFWDSTDDGRVYRGWEATHDKLAAELAAPERIGLLGFSQGAIVAAALCGLAAHGRFRPIDFAILVAGRRPRSDELRPLFTPPLAVPTLHIWGERDSFAKAESPTLVECFEPSTRELASFTGSHVLPTRGPAADAIVSFIEKHVRD